MKRFPIKPRWSLRTALILLTLTCVLFSRFIYFHNWASTSFGYFADVSYVSESPTVEVLEAVAKNRQAGFRQRMRVPRILKSASHQGWFDRAKSLLIQDRIEALSLPVAAVNESTIALLQKMPKLKHVIVLSAVRSDTFTDPTIDRLTQALPNAKIYPQMEQLGAPISLKATSTQLFQDGKSDSILESVLPANFENELTITSEQSVFTQ